MGWRTRDVVRTTSLVVAVLLCVKLFWVAHVLFFAVFLGMFVTSFFAFGICKALTK